MDAEPPRVAVVADAGTLSFVGDRPRGVEPASAWLLGARVGYRFDRLVDIEASVYGADPSETRHRLRVGPGFAVGGRVRGTLGPAIPIFGVRVGLVAVTESSAGESAGDVIETKPFMTITPSVGAEFPVSGRISVGSELAYTYGIDMRKPQLGPEAGRPPRSTYDRTWLTLSANVRYWF